MVSVQNLTKYFYKRNTRITALSDISFDVARGGFVSIVGPSGCGKSTILDLIVGMARPSAGAIRYDGRRVEGIAVGIGYLTQHDTLLSWRS
ncbi:MAG: ATP-binding cassette domain-containing protein, partial [Acetobacteraceae bacterium]